MTTSEQLEREAERTRGQIVDTLAELRDRMTPGQMLDQALNYARDGKAGEFARNLGRQVVDNPLPVALITAGIGWLALGGLRSNGRNGAGRAVATTRDWTYQASYRAEDWRQRAGESTEEWSARTQRMAAEAAARARRAADQWQQRITAARAELGEAAGAWADETRHTTEEWAQRAGETAETWTNRVEAMASDAGERARSMITGWRERAGAAGAALSQGASDTYERLSRGAGDTYDRTVRSARGAADAIGRSASAVGSGAADTSRGITRYVKDEPLILAGIGLAIGAALGAAIPESDFEKEWMGERSDALKSRVSAAGYEQWEKGKQVVETAWEEGKHEAERQGFVSEGGAESTGQPSLVPETGQPTEPLADASERPAG